MIQRKGTSFEARCALDVAFRSWHTVALTLIPRGAIEYCSDKWTASACPPPRTSSEALDPCGVWGAKSCGVVVRRCRDNEEKGLGAFAATPIKAGDLVGVYWGERLTKRQLSVRHGWNLSWWMRVDEKSITRLEASQREARERRISSYMPGHPSEGCPEGGDENGGKYVFMLRNYVHFQATSNRTSLENI